MGYTTIDASLCARMFLAGAKSLESKKEWINELNVFPVPDGDTGTNMSMTILSAAKEVQSLEVVNMAKLAKAMSSGSLKGARGNSGVILSQLFRGFCKVIKECEEIDVATANAAFQKATETAYKAVMKPKEGTILTVARGFSDKSAELFEENPDISMEELLAGALANAQETLDRTPEMLPVLKEAGVVDSGGQGLIQILQGAFDVFCGKEVEYDEEQPEEEKPQGYCVEFIVKLEKPLTKEEEISFAADMKQLGEDPVLLFEKNQAKVHIHALEPGALITRGAALGLLSSVKVEALCEGHHEQVVHAEDLQKINEQEEADKISNEPRKEVGFVSVAVGDGLGTIFKDLGCDCLIEGGQTMNPSTEDVLNAIEKVNADTVFVFPNNKNIILAASQAQSLVEDKKVIVIPTKTIPQGIAAMIGYLPEQSPEENEAAMLEEISRVKTCQMTYAVRDTKIDDKEIHEGDYMGVGDNGIAAVGTDLIDTTVQAIETMVDDESELISVYFGADVTEEDAQVLVDKLQETFDGCDVELNAGGQPVYYYILAVE